MGNLSLSLAGHRALKMVLLLQPIHLLLLLKPTVSQAMSVPLGRSLLF